MKKFDMIYVEGPGDLVESFRRWNNKEDVISETSKTFSGQFFDFCKSEKLKTYAISYCNDVKQEEASDFYVENRPKLSFERGVLYHIAQILYGLWIVGIVIRYRPKYLSVTSGVTYWFVLAPIKLLGIKIIPQLHNCLWPIANKPRGLFKRFLLSLDGWFFRRIAMSVLCVSPELKRQVKAISGISDERIKVFFAQFYKKDFNELVEPVIHSSKPFVITFAGRVERNKGVFDILEMAKALRKEDVIFEICGSGSELDNLVCQRDTFNLNKVYISGQLNRQELLTIYKRSHVVIVPTRSNCAEAFAMVAAESVLLGRPVICSSVVPAAEVLGGGAVQIPADDVGAYVAVVRQLLTDDAWYDELCCHCNLVRDLFLDGRSGLTQVLLKTLA